jgi:hypothetical protein
MKPWRRADRFGVVVHGPEVIDSGQALATLEMLEELGSIRAVLGGTMGRVAVIDAGLEHLIDISQRKTPSEALSELDPVSDLLILLNQAKSRDTGLAFGSKVSFRARISKPLLQIDWGGGFVAELGPGATSLALNLTKKTGLELLSSKGCPQEAELIGDMVRRRLVGVLPNEAISVNGTIVAHAKSTEVEILARDGQILEIRGAEPKAHGLEKLPLLDLKSAIIRSGPIRRTAFTPRRRCSDRGSGVVVIDHAAEGAFEVASGAGVVITVGDDTTAIAGEILSRLGTPLIGIVDGDLDCICQNTGFPPGSMVVTVRSGHDDMIGKMVVEKLRVSCPEAEELKSLVIQTAGAHLIRVENY